MEIFTRIDFEKLDIVIKPATRFVTMGSCFANEIGIRLANAGLTVCNNDLGICFNPFSLLKLLEYALGERTLDERLFVSRNVGFAHLDFHSKFLEPSVDELRHKLEVSIENAKKQIYSCDYLILTLGTNSVFCHRKTQQIVTNCHQQNPDYFEQKQLDTAELLSSYERILLKHFSDKRILISVSPVRYKREGFVESSLSKARLRVFCAELASRLSHVAYMPVYEVFMDELRDYRWYERDLLHPRAEAVDYVWQKFLAAYASPELHAHLQLWQKIQARLRHKARYPQSQSHLDFLEATQVLLEGCQGETKDALMMQLQKEIDALRASLPRA